MRASNVFREIILKMKRNFNKYNFLKLSVI